MDIKIKCPRCNTRLIVEDDLIGQLVSCEECNEQFTVTAPSPELPQAQPTFRRDDPEPAPSRRSSRHQITTDEDDRPRRRKLSSPGGWVPPFFGCFILFANLLMAVGFFYLFGFDVYLRTGSSKTPPVPVLKPAVVFPGQRIQLSQGRWEFDGQHLRLSYEILNGQVERVPMKLRLRAVTGAFDQTIIRPEVLNQTRATLSLPAYGIGRQPLKVWVEDFLNPGQVISNEVVIE